MSVVGIDIGGTKTRLVLAARDGSAVEAHREAVVPSASWRGDLGDPAADAAGLLNLLVAQFGTNILGVPLAVGAHGCDSTTQCYDLERELRSRGAGPVVVVNDSELMVPAMGLDAGIGVVVGTGSIATARSADGELLTAGGWGWLLGDEGSAPGLVREAVRAVLADIDRGGTVDPLGAHLMQAFGAHDGPELALAATQTASAESWGAHAPAVFAAADEGSTMAASVVLAAGQELARLIDSLVQRGVRAPAVVAGGAVIEGQPRLHTVLRDAVAQKHPDIDVQILGRPPVLGALALARRISLTTPTLLGSEN